MEENDFEEHILEERINMTENTEKKEFDLDTILENDIKFGKYQIFIFILIAFPIFMNGVYTASYVFTAGTLNYRCKVPECDADDASYLTPWLNYSTPFVSDSPEKCKRYQFVGSDENAICTEESFNRSAIETCSSFIYENSEITIQNKFDLTCNKEFYLSLVGTMNSIGQLFCYSISGIISDRYGRKIVIILGCLGSGVFGILRAFSFNYIQFATFEFMDSLFGAATYATALIIGMELVTPQLRSMFILILNCFYAFGGVFLSLIAMWYENYKTLLLITYAPSFIAILYIWLLPQSVRWLLSQGRCIEAEKLLQKACRINGTKLNPQTLNSLAEKIATEKISQIDEKENEADKKKTSLKAIAAIANLSFCWFSCIFIYYGLTLNSVYLEYWNKYINFIFICVIEIPAYFICEVMMDKIGRKKTLFIGLMGSGFSCILTNVVSGTFSKTSFFIVGKLLITIATTCLYLFTLEVFPTNLRHRFFSICSVVGRFGAIIAPLTPLLIDIYPTLPLFIFAFFSFTSSLILFYLPETVNRKLPETAKEAFE